MNKKWLYVISGILLLVVLLYPVHHSCGRRGTTCAVPPIAGETEPSSYYEFAPLGIILLEELTDTDIYLSYWQGYL